MAFYYRINDVLDAIDRAATQDGRLQILVPVSCDELPSQENPEDVFILSSTPKILDLREAEGIHNLAQLLDEVPLYNINLELIMDLALTERHKNRRISQALSAAFGKQPLPNTLKPDADSDDEGMSGGLRHPMLAHTENQELCRLYISFLKSLDRDHEFYGFEKNILGKQPSRFVERFDGFASPDDAKVKAQILIAFGMRRDHNPAIPMEMHVQNGEKRARKMAIEEPREIIWAWLEAEDYQARRCRDIHRIMQLKGLPKIPNWVRVDLFSCLEREAMKQIFAQSLRAKDPAYAFLENTKSVLQGVKTNAAGDVDPALQRLLSQVLSPGATYSGAALDFAETIRKRSAEAKRSSLA